MSAVRPAGVVLPVPEGASPGVVLMREGDIVKGDNGFEFELGPMMSYQGKADCQHAGCRRMGSDWANGDLGECAGYHCAYCDEPCSMYGHKACQEAAA